MLYSVRRVSIENTYKRIKDVSMSDHGVYQIMIFALLSLVSVTWRPHHYWVNEANTGV